MRLRPLKVPSLLALSATVALGGCASTEYTETVTGLTVDEAIYVGQTLLRQSIAAGLIVVPQPESASTTASVADEVTFTADCPASGTVQSTVAYEGQLDQDSEAIDLQVAVRQSHDQCRIEGFFAGTSITLSGDPSAQSEGLLSVVAGGAYETSGTLLAQVQWLSGAREGTCVIELNYTGSGAGFDQIGVFNLQGIACGIPVARAVTFQPA
jgi:hypothetical protein